jgi:sugar phosphate isomerase/epimerase
LRRYKTMKLGVCSTLYRFLPLEQAMDYVVAAGLNVIELACGGYPGYGLCNPAELLADDAKLKKFLKVFEDRGIEINALAAHGNPLHPQAEIREQHQADFRNAILLAEKIGVDKVINFSGCPGDSDEAKHPNWCVIPWPSDYAEVLEWQWKSKVIPYWQEMAQFAADHNVNRVAIELHPGFVVYNVRTMLRLREAAGPVIGANMDPSHLFWQGVDPIRAILALGEAIFHVHLKDTAFNPDLNPVHGVLDPTSVRDIPNRCWIFRTVGYGHDALFWKQFISALQQVGYEDAVCIEHEDRLIGGHEGLQKSLAFLKDTVIKQRGGQDWWLLPE